MKKCNILATGPSIKKFKPNGLFTYGVNTIAEYHNPDILVTVDTFASARERGKWILEAQPMIHYSPITNPDDVITQLPEYRRFKIFKFLESDANYLGIRESRETILAGWHYNSVFSAVCIAFVDGYREFNLYGVDFTPEYPLACTREELLEAWSRMNRIIQESGGKMIIHSDISALNEVIQ